MKTKVSIPDLALIAMTRGLLGAGIGLILAGKLDESQRRPLGWGLIAIGLLSTVPLAVQVFSGIERPAPKPAKSRARARASSAE